MSINSPNPAPRFTISCGTEFNRLRSIIVGTAIGANHPNPDDPSLVNFFMPPNNPQVRAQVWGPFSQQIVEETEQDLDELVRTLEGFDVEVFRPTPNDCSVEISSPLWKTDQLYSLMPRDCFLVVGNTVIETASPTRARYFEHLSYRPIFYHHRKTTRFRWLAAPRPSLSDDSFGPNPLENNAEGKLLDNEILFDAANCMRIGRDIFIDINRSANLLAADWLQHDVLGDQYRVYPIALGLDHIDVTIVPIRPGLLLVDDKKVPPQKIPEPLKSWDVIRLPAMPELSYGLQYPLASNGIGRNILMIDPSTAIVGKEQTQLIVELEKRQIDVIPLSFRHARTFGGSFHCVTLDLHRDGDSSPVSYL